MGKYEKLILQILRGASDANIAFDDLCQLLRRLGFDQRVRGSHHNFRRQGIEQKINLQKDGSQAISGEASSRCHCRKQTGRGNEGRKLMSRYEIILYWGDEDQAFVAETPELPGCAAHGETPESALANVRQAMSLWLDTARKYGDEIPQPKGRRLLVA